MNQHERRIKQIMTAVKRNRKHTELHIDQPWDVYLRELEAELRSCSASEIAHYLVAFK